MINGPFLNHQLQVKRFCLKSILQTIGIQDDAGFGRQAYDIRSLKQMLGWTPDPTIPNPVQFPEPMWFFPAPRSPAETNDVSWSAAAYQSAHPGDEFVLGRG